MKRIAGLCLLAGALTAAAQAPVKVPAVSYADLGKLVREQRGKVVVVYFYAEYCTPCKTKGLPALAKIHDKYAASGLTVIAANIDKADDAKAKGRLEEFLTDKIRPKYATVNVDPKSFDYDRQINTEGVPAAFVFNRENRWVGRWPVFSADGKTILQEVDYDAIEKTVAELLEKK